MTKSPIRLFLTLVSGIFLQLSCTAASVTMATDGPATLSLVPWDRLQDEGEVVGASPQTIPLDKLQGKILKIGAPDKENQYWVFTAAQGSTVTAKATLIAKATPDKNAKESGKAGKNKRDPESAAAIRKMNSHIRILMNSYEALTSERYDLARELATQLNQLDPMLAAAHVIIGLSYLKQGQAQSAVASFRKARSLDPEDKDIEVLLQMVQ